MKKINVKWIFILVLIMVLVMGCYFGMYAYGHETLSRIDHTLRDSHVFLKAMVEISFFIPIVILLGYVVFRKKLKVKLNVNNFYTVLIFSLSYIVVGTLYGFIISSLLSKGTLGFCDIDLEAIPMGTFGACFLSGLEYTILEIWLFVPLVIIIIFEMLLGLHKKIFKIDKIKFKDVVMVIIYFLILCLIGYGIVYVCDVLL